MNHKDEKKRKEGKEKAEYDIMEEKWLIGVFFEGEMRRIFEKIKTTKNNGLLS